MGLNGNISADYASIVGKVRAFTVDNTLTISGACADAKATGDAIKKMDTATALATAEEAKRTAENAEGLAGSAVDTASDAMAALAKFADAAHVVTNAYTGNGATSRSLSFPFEPSVVFVVSADASDSSFSRHSPMLVAIRGMSKASTTWGYNGSDQGRVNLTWSGKTLSWAFDTELGNGSGSLCMNTNGMTYCYVAFGTKDD